MGSHYLLIKILTEYRERLCEVLGDNLDSVVLFGSRAFTTIKDYGANEIPFPMNVHREGVPV